MAIATATRTLKSFKLACPLCGATEAIDLNLNDLTTLECGECGEGFSPATAVRRAAEQLRRWQAVATWIGMAGACLDQAEVWAEIEAE